MQRTVDNHWGDMWVEEPEDPSKPACVTHPLFTSTSWNKILGCRDKALVMRAQDICDFSGVKKMQSFSSFCYTGSLGIVDTIEVISGSTLKMSSTGSWLCSLHLPTILFISLHFLDWSYYVTSGLQQKLPLHPLHPLSPSRFSSHLKPLKASFPN